MKILRDAGALPDHIQLDGASEGFSPGSGNAPPGADTSLPANEAVIVMNAILKKLGVRDQVYLEATGGIHDPVQGVEKLALGADGISGARYVWMKKALGCRDARKCANGSCPWGYTAKEGTMLAISMNPTKIAPLGNAAMTNWWKEYVKMLSETGIDDWRLIREQGGFAAEEPVVRKQAAYKYPSLDEYYDRRYVRNLLRGALTRAEVDYHVYGRR
jgi:glutamate synthase domain-containing protein 2